MASKNRVSTPAGAAFTKHVTQPDPNFQPGTEPEFDPTRPGTFDLGAFISGAKQHTNTRTIPVTSRPAVAAELEQAVDERDKLARVVDEDKQTGSGSPRRLSVVSERAKKLRALDDRIAELEPQLDGTWVMVKMRGLTPTEQDTIRKAKYEVGVPLAAACFAAAATVQAEGAAPDDWTRLTQTQWVDLIEVIGFQYLTLDKAFEALTYQAVTPDFFERFSASRATRSTSAN